MDEEQNVSGQQARHCRGYLKAPPLISTMEAWQEM